MANNGAEQKPGSLGPAERCGEVEFAVLAMAQRQDPRLSELRIVTCRAMITLL